MKDKTTKRTINLEFRKCRREIQVQNAANEATEEPANKIPKIEEFSHDYLPFLCFLLLFAWVRIL